jgi:RimJ/RimL family protein N-acetyltransferase
MNNAKKSSTSRISSFSFEKAQPHHEKMIFEWLAEPHMQEFWDNSQEHKDDIICFMKGRKEKSGYFKGISTYWVGCMEEQPFCFILTAEVNPQEEYPPIWRDHMSTTGKTYSIDFGIGNKEFLNRGLASPTLVAFTEFFKSKIDSRTDTFFIDPDDNNLRARHVYEKAGFNVVGDFKGEKRYWAFKGEKTYLMVKKI